MLVFSALEAPESDGLGEVNEVVGGLFELRLTDQIRGASFFRLITIHPSLSLIVYVTPVVSV